MNESFLRQIEQILAYNFNDPSYIDRAFTHSSYTEDRLSCNERLEFFGDSVLALVICRRIFEQFPDYFEGDLTNLGLADIFQTLGMNRQSGTLVVKQTDTERRFYFSDEGVSLLTVRSARKFRRGNLLVGMGKLSESDLKVAVTKQERVKDTKLGDLLLQTGLVKEEDISEACKYQAAEEIYDSFNWTSGKFQFLEGANAGPEGGPGPFADAPGPAEARRAAPQAGAGGKARTGGVRARPGGRGVSSRIGALARGGGPEEALPGADQRGG